MDEATYRRSFAIQLSPAPYHSGGDLRDGDYYRWSQVVPLERLPFMFICKTSKLAANIARRSDQRPSDIQIPHGTWSAREVGDWRLIVTPSNCKCPGNKACRVTGAFIVALLVSAFYRSRNSGTGPVARDAIALSLQMRRRGASGKHIWALEPSSIKLVPEVGEIGESWQRSELLVHLDPGCICAGFYCNGFCNSGVRHEYPGEEGGHLGHYILQLQSLWECCIQQGEQVIQLASYCAHGFSLLSYTMV